MPSRMLQLGSAEPGTRNTAPTVRRRNRLPVPLQFALLGLLIFLSVGAADTGSRFNTLGHKLMCTCGCGQVLLECNHVGCTDSDRMRKELMAAINRGGTDKDVLDWFVAKYGPVVLAAPTTTGFNRVAWIMPYAALALGLAFTAVVVRAWNVRRRPTTVPVSPLPSAELEEWRRRVHEETEI